MATCTCEKFCESAAKLVEYSRNFDLTWCRIDTEDGGCYLKTSCVTNIKSGQTTKSHVNPGNTDDTDTTEEDIEDEDSSCLTLPPDSMKRVIFEYHLLHNESYQQPVLYFNAHHQDGRLLSLDEIWGNTPDLYKERLKNEGWSIVTQQEHPILHRPFFYIHPCHTEQLMGKVPATRNYLVSWLSVFGPLVGLSVPLTYAELT